MDASVGGEMPEQSKAEPLSQMLYKTAVFAFGRFEVSGEVTSDEEISSKMYRICA